MSCETTLVRLEGRDGVAWIDPLVVVNIVPHSPGYSRLSWGRGENFTAAGTPDKVHALLFPEEDGAGEPPDGAFCEECGAPFSDPPSKGWKRVAVWAHDCDLEAGEAEAEPSLNQEATECGQGEVAGFCERCDGPVHHRPGKPGEYDHDCPAEAQMAVADSEVDARSNLIDDMTDGDVAFVEGYDGDR